LSRELEIEQLQSDIASLGRIQDVMQDEIYKAQDELCCMTQKSNQFEVEVTLHIPPPPSSDLIMPLAHISKGNQSSKSTLVMYYPLTMNDQFSPELHCVLIPL
jgi:hypothetical protein